MQIVSGLTLLLMIAGIACSTNEARDSDAISVEDATAILVGAHVFASEQDLDGLCGLGGAALSCQRTWRNLGEWPAAPDEEPEIIDSEILPTLISEDGNRQIGGRILTVAGVDGLGSPYSTEFLVFYEDSGRLVALNPVYWSSASVGHARTDGTEVAEPEATPAT